MKNVKVLTVLLAAGLALSSPLIANAKKGGGGGESQAGGLPGLEDRVEADELLITTLQGQVAALQTKVTDLLGQNNWAVVDAAGDTPPVRASSPAISVVHVSAGVYEVNFGKSVSGCAYNATIGDTAHAAPTQGQISVSGDVDTDSGNDVFVYTFDKTGVTATDSPFHLYVSCP
jgi:hypothetical protein